MAKTQMVPCSWHGKSHPHTEFWKSSKYGRNGYFYSCKAAYAEMRENREKRKVHNLSRAQEMGLISA